MNLIFWLLLFKSRSLIEKLFKSRDL